MRGSGVRNFGHSLNKLFSMNIFGQKTDFNFQKTEFLDKCFFADVLYEQPRYLEELCSVSCLFIFTLYFKNCCLFEFLRQLWTKNAPYSSNLTPLMPFSVNFSSTQLLINFLYKFHSYLSIWLSQFFFVYFLLGSFYLFSPPQH